MFTTTFDNNDLKVIIEEPVQKELMSKGINPIEVFRLIESFASKIMASKQDELIKLTNDDTGASLALDVRWESGNMVSVTVSIVTLENLTIDEQPRSKVNLADMVQPQQAAESAAA